MPDAHIKKKISFGFVTGGISLTIDALAGLAIFPLLLHFLNKELAGLWIIFISTSTFVYLGQAGLAPIVMRYTAEVKSNKFVSEIHNNFWSVVSFAYKIVAFVVIIICLSIYLFYIKTVLIENSYLSQGTICWLFLSGGFVTRLYGVKFLHIINGLGEIGLDKVLNIIISFTTILFYLIVLFFGYDLIGLGISYFITSIFYYAGANYLFNTYNKGIIKKRRGNITLVKLIPFFKQGSKILILNMVAFAISQSSIFILERIVGLRVVPLYSALLQIITMIIAVSGLYSQMMFPFIAQYWAKNDYRKVNNLYRSNIKYVTLISLSISILVFILAPLIIPLWLGKGNFLGSHIFGVMLLFGIFYIHQSAQASSVIATNSNYFLLPAIINAVSAILLSIILGLKYGIVGIALGNLLGTVIPSLYIGLWSYKFFQKKMQTQVLC